MAITRKSLATRGAKWLAILTLAGCMSPTLGYAQEIPLAAVDAAVMASSNETGLARTEVGVAWTAEIVRPISARTAPDTESTTLMKLEPYGAGSLPTTLLATRGFRDRTHRDWVRVQLNRRPNETTGWVPADAVLLRRTDVRVVVLMTSRRLEVWRGTQRALSVPVGIGRSQTPTPTGRFAIDDMWETDATTRRIYGRFVFALTAHSDVLKRFNGGEGRIAFHGGGSSRRIGARSSFGCIIVSDQALQRLWKLVGPGTPVTIVAD